MPCDQSTIGRPGSWKRFRWFAREIAVPLVVVFAIIGFTQIVWEVVQYVR